MGYTMLLADDSVTTHRAMELTFAGQGIRVVSVTDGDQALERMQTARPDILLAEVALPRLDGYRLTEHLREMPTLSDVPVLLLTGAFDVVDEGRVRASGASGIIVKPFEPEVVIKRVKDLLGLSSKERESSPTRLVTPAEPPAPSAEAQAPEPSVTEPVDPAELDDLLAADKPAPTPAGDDYLAALDDAFSSLDARLSGSSAGPSVVTRPPIPPTPRPEPLADAEPPVFEIDEEWFGGALEAQRNRMSGAAPGAGTFEPVSDGELSAAISNVTPFMPPAAAPGPARPSNVADSFHALLAEEQSTSVAPPAAADPLTISDEAIERIAQRVADRLSEGVFVDTVRRVVEEVAERLVREEIARIRARVETGRE